MPPTGRKKQLSDKQNNNKKTFFLIVVFNLVLISSNVTGAGIVKEATAKTKIYQCFPLYTMLLALGNPRWVE